MRAHPGFNFKKPPKVSFLSLPLVVVHFRRIFLTVYADGIRATAPPIAILPFLPYSSAHLDRHFPSQAQKKAPAPSARPKKVPYHWKSLPTSDFFRMGDLREME